jgi:hypothetical protein
MSDTTTEEIDSGGYFAQVLASISYGDAAATKTPVYRGSIIKTPLQTYAQ